MSTHPDFIAGEVSAQTIVDALRTKGCCVLRSLVPLETVQEIRRCILIEYDLLDQRFESQTMTEEEHRHCYRYGILRPFEQEYILESGQPMAEVMLALIQQTILREVYHLFFQEDILSLLIPSSHVRRIYPKDGVPFHQDSSVMRLHQVELMNSWFPLDPAGVNAPSVEMYPQAQKKCWPSGLENDGSLYGHLQITQEQILQALPETELWAPQLFPGDVLLLQSYTVHRTHLRPEMTEVRRDFEMRVARSTQLQHRSDIRQQLIQIQS